MSTLFLIDVISLKMTIIKGANNDTTTSGLTYTLLYPMYFFISVIVTLFELMVVNNWWIIMEGFHFAIGDKRARIFFILFHLTTAVS